MDRTPATKKNERHAAGERQTRKRKKKMSTPPQTDPQQQKNPFRVPCFRERGSAHGDKLDGKTYETETRGRSRGLNNNILLEIITFNLSELDRLGGLDGRVGLVSWLS